MKLIIVAVALALCKLSKSQLTSMSVKEVGCPTNMADLKFLPIANNYPSIPFLVREYIASYLPMASQFTYRRYAEVFLGRAANSQSEIDSMKYMAFGPYNVGYGSPQFAQVGQPYRQPNGTLSDQFIVNFRALPFLSRPGTNASALELINSGLVWTDNSTAALLVDCMNGDALDWGVYSINPTIEQSTIDLVLEKIQRFGFDPLKAEYLTY